MIPYVELHITDHCNLNCVGCSHFSSISKPYYKDLTEFEEEMRELSRFDIGTLRLMGGEPLLHPHWIEFCEIARKYFQHTNIVLVTNGILSKQLTPRLNELNISVCISDYHLNIPTPSFLNTVKHDKGVLYNISLDLEGTQDEKKAFDNCDLHIHHWYFFKDGKLYPCCVMPNFHIFVDYFKLDIEVKECGIEIKGHTEQEIKEFLDRPTPMCKYCNTIARNRSKVKFSRTKGEIDEWICH